VITNDSAELFNWLTGVSVFPNLKKIKAAPEALHKYVMQMIRKEEENARNGKPSGVFAKVNSLVEPEVIEALYSASQAGVPIRLLIRGICCLRSKVPGISDNITVRSIVGRFLEHSRIYRFENAGQPELTLASADWMARNFFRRVETCFPIEESGLRARIEEMLEIYWSDNSKAREQGVELAYFRRPNEGERIDAQAIFLEQASRPRKPEVDAKPAAPIPKIPAVDLKQREEKIAQPV
jgi:polyphosphate kinase